MPVLGGAPREGQTGPATTDQHGTGAGHVMQALWDRRGVYPAAAYAYVNDLRLTERDGCSIRLARPGPRP
jgi:hypothetical protein